jgi:hypothetical protein
VVTKHLAIDLLGTHIDNRLIMIMAKREFENMKRVMLIIALMVPMGLGTMVTVCRAENCWVVEYPDKFEAICEGNAPSASLSQTKLPTAPVMPSKPPEIQPGQLVVPNNAATERPKQQTTNVGSQIQTGRRVRPSPAVIENARMSRNKVIEQHLQNAPEKTVQPQKEMIEE